MERSRTLCPCYASAFSLKHHPLLSLFPALRLCKCHTLAVHCLQHRRKGSSLFIPMPSPVSQLVFNFAYSSLSQGWCEASLLLRPRPAVPKHCTPHAHATRAGRAWPGAAAGGAGRAVQRAARCGASPSSLAPTPRAPKHCNSHTYLANAPMLECLVTRTTHVCRARPAWSSCRRRGACCAARGAVRSQPLFSSHNPLCPSTAPHTRVPPTCRARPAWSSCRRRGACCAARGARWSASAARPA